MINNNHVFLLLFLALVSISKTIHANPFHFFVTSDPHMHTDQEGNVNDAFLKYTLPAILNHPDGPGALMVTAGDLDNFATVKQAVESVLGNDYLWYPAVGNHDITNTANDGVIDNGSRLRELRAYNREKLQNIVNWGPDATSVLDGYDVTGAKDTNYSFDYENVHFVVLDHYYENTYGRRGLARVFNSTYDWLEADLEQTDKEHILVFGHEPVFPAGDLDFPGHVKPGTLERVNPEQRDRFWQLLKDKGVKAYFCGHVHIHKIDDHEGVKQVLIGFSKRAAWNTFLKVDVDKNAVTITPYRYEQGDRQYVTRPATTIISEVIPEYTLPSGQWTQLSMPGLPPNTDNTVASIFGDDINGVYYTDWVLYRYNRSTFRYDALQPTDSLASGEAIWILQQTGQDVTLDLPDNSTQPVPVVSSQCPSTKGCFEIPLSAAPDKQLSWRMLGNPFLRPVNWNQVRLTTNGGACDSGCTLDQAAQNQLIHSTAWSYHGEAYHEISENTSVQPWQGFWFAVLPGVDGLESKLLVPVDDAEIPVN
jgi:hypothetical protein